MAVKGPRDYLQLGTWNSICDRCGFKFKASELKLEWDGLYVCEKCFEPRQPQDFVRGVADVQTPPWTRPDGAEIFIYPTDVCTVFNSQGIVGIGVVGCMVVGRVLPEQ